MTAANVARRMRSRFGPPIIGVCAAIAVLGAGLLFATPQTDVPLPTDNPRPNPGAPPPMFFGLTHLTPNHVARV